jgi:hypothetical protein
MSLSKKFTSIYKSFYYLKQTLQCLMNVFIIIIHSIDFKSILMFPWYIKNTTI